jgi:hypothetical protein
LARSFTKVAAEETVKATASAGRAVGQELARGVGQAAAREASMTIGKSVVHEVERAAAREASITVGKSVVQETAKAAANAVLSAAPITVVVELPFLAYKVQNTIRHSNGTANEKASEVGLEVVDSAARVGVSLGGGAIGQALIPLPVVGFAIGSFIASTGYSLSKIAIFRKSQE